MFTNTKDKEKKKKLATEVLSIVTFLSFQINACIPCK